MDSGIPAPPSAGIPPRLRRLPILLLASLLLLVCAPRPGAAAPPDPLRPPEHLVRRAALLPSAPKMDGSLEDWPTLPAAAGAFLGRADQLHPGLKEAWEGAADASAQVWMGVHGEDLYLGVRFFDDIVFHDPEQSWWHGDSLEIFLDPDRPTSGPPPHTFTENCRQLFLMPANPDLSWGVVYRGLQLVFDDGGLRGVEVARGPAQPDGYSAELRIPLENLGIGPEGGRIGFALALNDADEAPERPGSYLSWNGGFDLYLHPDHFGVLEIPPHAVPQEPPPAEAPGPWWLLSSILVGLGAALLLAGPGARWLTRIGPKPKGLVLVGTLVLAGGIYYEAGSAVARAEDEVLEGLAHARDEAATIVQSARTYGALEEDDAQARGRALETLLRGGQIPCRPGVEDAALVGLHPDGRFLAAGAQPAAQAIDLRLPQTFFLPPGVDATNVRITFDVGARGPRDQTGRTLGTFTFHGSRGGEVERDLRDEAGVGTRQQSIRLALGADGGPWHRISWRPAETQAPLTLRSIHAVRVAEDGGESEEAILLSDETRDRIPVLAAAGGADFGVTLAAGEARTLPLPTLPGADRLWLLLRSERAFPQLLGDPVLATLALHHEAGSDPTPVEVRNGEHLTADRLPAGIARPPGMRSLVAFEWTDSLGRTHIRQAVPLPLDPQRPARALSIVNNEAGGTLRLVAATLVRTRYAPAEAEVRIVTDEYGRDALLLPTVPETLAHVWENEVGESDAEITRTYELGSSGTRIPLTLRGRLPEGVASKPARAQVWVLACLALAVFVLVLLVVDVTSHLRFLSWRLGLGMLAAALVPLALTLVLVDRENARRVEARFETRGRASAEELTDRIREARMRVQEAAERMARHIARELEPTEVSEISRLAALYGASARAQGLEGSVAISGASLPALLVPLSEGQRARGLRAPRFLQQLGDRPGVHLSPWDGLLLVGTARAGRGEEWVHVTIGVRVQDAFLEASQREEPETEDATVLLLDEQARLLAHRGPRPGSVRRDLAPRLGAARIMGGGGPVVLSSVGPADAAQLAVLQHLDARTTDDTGAAWIAVGLDRALIDVARGRERELLVWLGLFGLLLVVGVAALVARRIVDPVRELVRVSDSVRQGTFDVEAPAAGADEIGRLSVALDQMRRDLKHRVADLDYLRGAQDALAASLEFDSRTQVMLQLFAGRFAPDRCLLLEAHGPRGPVSVVGETGGESRFVPRPLSPTANSWLDRALSADAPLEVEASANDEAFPVEGGMGRRLLAGALAWIAVPLKTGSITQGLLLMGWKDREALPSPEARRLIVPLAGVSASALNNARLYRLAALDEVTHLPGATSFEAALRSDVDAALAGGPDAVLLRIGLDHMEHATLRRGVEHSRELLRTCANALLAVVGDQVRVARLREDELAARLPGASPDEARALAEAVRERLGLVEVIPDEGGEPIGTTVSIGIARCPRNARSLEFLLDAAGRALASAQREGGDHVEDATRLEVGAVDMPPFEEGAIFRNEAMVRVVESARRAARSDASVFITGETGTGKEVIANLIHRRSDRAQRPFVTVNCAAFPETLLESELFGHERGAFTGAERRREGRFELADGGTLFLDEVAEMTPSAQVKLLRVLQERQFARLGGTRTITVDVRIVAATNRDLEGSVADGSFREDLYYRLNVIRLEIPPLRLRREEIPPLVDLFLREAARRNGSTPKRLTPAAMDILYRHPWPGNVRELKNVLERCAILTEGEVVGPEHLQLDGSRSEGSPYLPPQSAPQDDLNARQRKLLDHLARHGRCTNREYYEMAGTSPRTGLRDLQDLMTRGLLIREGKRRGAVYRLP